MDVNLAIPPPERLAAAKARVKNSRILRRRSRAPRKSSANELQPSHCMGEQQELPFARNDSELSAKPREATSPAATSTTFAVEVQTYVCGALPSQAEASVVLESDTELHSPANALFVGDFNYPTFDHPYWKANPTDHLTDSLHFLQYGHRDPRQFFFNDVGHYSLDTFPSTSQYQTSLPSTVNSFGNMSRDGYAETFYPYIHGYYRETDDNHGSQAIEGFEESNNYPVWNNGPGI